MATPSTAARCSGSGDTAFPGVIDVRPDGWLRQTGSPTVDGYSMTSRTIYGPPGISVPPDEGPHRLVLYETFPRSDVYFSHRIEQSRNRGGVSVAVTVCGEATDVWVDGSSGELVLGWTDRNKSDVLVGNTADFTVGSLVDSAEGVADCCG